MAERVEHEPLLEATQISPPLEATSYAEVLDELAAFAARQQGVVDGERFMSQVSSLGADDTIAVGGGAFLPHLKSDAIDREVVVMGITGRPLRVPVESGEETRGRLFVLVAVPPDEHAGYLEKVASIAAALRGEGVIYAILEAGDPARIAELPAIREAPRVQRLSVVDVMDPAAQRVYPDMALPDAARVLIRGRHSALPVVNKRDEIVGMVSEKDLIKAFLPGYLRISGGAGSENGGERESALPAGGSHHQRGRLDHRQQERRSASADAGGEVGGSHQPQIADPEAASVLIPASKRDIQEGAWG